MVALKEVGGLARRAGTHMLSQSPLWNQDVATITLEQIVAFIAKCKGLCLGDAAESAIAIALDEVKAATKRGDIEPSPMLHYFQRPHLMMTFDELWAGLQALGQAEAAATLFALETDLAADEVATLTHEKLANMREQGPLSELAGYAADYLPRHLYSPYVFWRTNMRGATVGMFGLEAAVFEAFGMVWGELRDSYQNIILLDGNAEASRLMLLLQRH